jgi:AcrR family transcriptional regulator
VPGSRPAFYSDKQLEGFPKGYHGRRVLKDMEMSAKNTRISLRIRRPTQARGRQKFESILDAADKMLVTRDPAEISIYDLAADLKTSPPSIYHFFPDISLVFVGLAERYIRNWANLSLESDHPVAGWQELLDVPFERVRVVFETCPPVRKILLGPGLSYEILDRDLATSVVNARRLVELMERHFVMPAIPNLVERLVEVIRINDAMWMLSIHRHGTITDEAAESARRARTAYLRTFLPEFLPRRTATGPDNQRGARAKAGKDRK